MLAPERRRLHSYLCVMTESLLDSFSASEPNLDPGRREVQADPAGASPRPTGGRFTEASFLFPSSLTWFHGLMLPGLFGARVSSVEMLTPMSVPAGPALKEGLDLGPSGPNPTVETPSLWRPFQSCTSLVSTGLSGPLQTLKIT